MSRCDLGRDADSVQADAPGLAGSRTAAHFQRIGRPARRSSRSGCSVRSRATPVPTVPIPIKPT